MSVAVRSFFLLGKDGHVVTRVVGELVGVEGVERFRCAKYRSQRLRVRLQESRVTNLFHHAFGTVHREDVGRLDHLVTKDERLAVLVVVTVHRERKAFKESAVHTGRVAEVNGGAKDKYISLPCAFEDGPEVVAQGAHAVRLGVLELAGKAALATGEADVVEIDEFSFGSRLLCARFRRLEHLGGIPSLARAGVKEHGEWFVVACHFSCSITCSRIQARSSS